MLDLQRQRLRAQKDLQLQRDVDRTVDSFARSQEMAERRRQQEEMLRLQRQQLQMQQQLLDALREQP
jgi:hypothetical protein